jgi:signal transduction histidine kinase
LTVAWIGPDPVTPQLLQDVSLVVSELVTNAVRAGCDRLTIRLSVDGHRMRLAVIDDGGGTPVRQQLRIDATSGRGLAIVGALSSDWGVRRLATGKEVWADLALSAS